MNMQSAVDYLDKKNSNCLNEPLKLFHELQHESSLNSFGALNAKFSGGRGRGALPYKPIRDLPFFRVSFFSLNS